MRSTSASAAVLEALRRRLVRWDPPRPWAVGFSGGRDSAVLLWALAEAAGPEAVTALHVDHGWRSDAERAAELATAEALCRRLGVALVTAPAPEQPGRTEASARRHRYSAFEAWRTGRGGGTVFLAHHRDDQAETVLMRLLQGRSWQGLAGIPARRGPYRRPLLSLGRDVLAAAAAEQGLAFHDDSTNTSSGPLRNFLRLEVFPRLEERFPAAPKSLADFARRWSSLAPRPHRDPAWSPTPAGWEVAAAVWDGWTPAVREAQLLACRDAGGPVRLSRRFLEALSRAGRARPAQGQGHHWSRTAGSVRWERVVQESVKEYFIQVSGAGTTPMPGVRLTWSTGGPEGAFVAGLDPLRPWSVRSSGGLGWNKALRRKRLGAVPPDRLAVIAQDGDVLAVADLGGRCLLWSDSPPEKLNNRGIFVSLE